MCIEIFFSWFGLNMWLLFKLILVLMWLIGKYDKIVVRVFNYLIVCVMCEILGKLVVFISVNFIG